MESYLLDWANLLLRWLHVITAIAWIGSSFYFVFLDSSLTPPEDEGMKRDGVSGELWAVHGGGFYHPVKFNVSPPKMPDHLHWFYWESYTTWLSGFALLTVSYLWNAGIYLVSPSNPLMSSSMAIVAALGFLVVFWLLYDAICRAFGQKPNGDATVGAFAALAAATLRNVALIRALEQSGERQRQIAHDLMQEALRREGHLIGRSAAMHALRREIAAVAATDLAVLITGDLTMRARSHEFAAACDWIGALDVPVTVEVGNHDELMAVEGHYYRLYQAQARNVDGEAGSGSPSSTEDQEGERE